MVSPAKAKLLGNSSGGYKVDVPYLG